MGLDQYLHVTKYCSDYSNKDMQKKILALFPDIPKSTNMGSVEVTIEIGYWRKANAIHKWFVDNVQDGEDNCATYSVSREDLIKLKALCEKVLKDHAKAAELLPGQEGFFFGGSEYDKWYFENLKDTIKIINKCLALDKDYYFEYHSSW